MSLNLLTELQQVIADGAEKNSIITVISYNSVSGLLEYSSQSGTGSFISSTAYSAGDSLIMRDGLVVGLAEPVAKTLWLS